MRLYKEYIRVILGFMGLRAVGLGAISCKGNLSKSENPAFRVRGPIPESSGSKASRARISICRKPFQNPKR